MWMPGQKVAASPPVAPEKTVAAVVVASDKTVDSASPKVQGLPKDHFTAALAYVTVIPAIVFLLIDPFKRNRFIRFHASQSIFFAIGVLLIALAMRLLYSLLALIPVAGYLLAWLMVFVLFLGLLILWVVLMVKAIQGEMFKLPVIGNLAEKL